MCKSRCLSPPWRRLPNNLHRSLVFPFTLLLLCVFCGCSDQPEPVPNYHEYAYVTNGGSNTVTVIDLRALTVLKTIAVGKSPTGVAANPRRNEIYVANTDSNNVSVIDAESNRVVSTIGVHRSPFFVEVSSDGTRAYVANSGSSNLSVIDLEQRKVVKTIVTGNGSNLARLTPDGKSLVVALRDEDSVAIVDTAQMALRAKVRTCGKPVELAIV